MPNRLRYAIAPAVALAAGAALALGGVVPAFADAADPTTRFTFTTSEDEATITGYTGSSTDLAIPETVSSGGNTYVVKAIGDDAFSGVTLTGITIPDTVLTIGNYAFAEQGQLTSIAIPNSVTSIGFGAFQDNRAVTSLTLGDGLRTIGGYAFYWLDITTVTIPPLVNEIDSDAFASDTSLSSVHFAGAAPTTIGPSTDSPLGSAADVTVYYAAEFASQFGQQWDGYTTQEATPSPPPAPVSTALPSNDSLYAITCVHGPGELLSVGPTTGQSTVVGASSPTAHCGWATSWDTVDSTAYFQYDYGHGPLEKIDPGTGVISSAFQPNLGSGEKATIDAFTIAGDGTMFALYRSRHVHDLGLYTVDTTTGLMTFVGSTGLVHVHSIAADPHTGVLYAVDLDGKMLYSINPETGVADTLTGALGLDLGSDFIVDSLQVDSSGLIWAEADNNRSTTDVSVINPTTYSVTPKWAITVGGSGIDAWSLMIVPKQAVPSKPTLATTGVTINPATIPFALLALGVGLTLVIIGWICVRRRRRQV